LQFGTGTDAFLADMYRPMLQRETNRALGTPSVLEPETVDLLQSAAHTEGARLLLLTSRGQIDCAAAILGAADRVRYLTPELHTEMVSELRWPGDRVPDSGIDVDDLGLDPTDQGILDILCRSDVMAHLAKWNIGTRLGDYARDRILASSAVAVVIVEGEQLTDYARGGAAAEAVWVLAQDRGLAVHPVTPTFLYANHPDELHELSPTFARLQEQLQLGFRELTGARGTERAALVLRLFTAPPTSRQSRRRGLDTY
jgi:hypothetical protein